MAPTIALIKNPLKYELALKFSVNGNIIYIYLLQILFINKIMKLNIITNITNITS